MLNELQTVSNPSWLIDPHTANDKSGFRAHSKAIRRWPIGELIRPSMV